MVLWASERESLKGGYTLHAGICMIYVNQIGDPYRDLKIL